MSWAQGLGFPVAEPGPGREGTNEVCVPEREASSGLQMSPTRQFIQGQPGPPQPPSLTASHREEPTTLLLSFMGRLVCCGFEVLFSSPDNVGDNCGEQ